MSLDKIFAFGEEGVLLVEEVAGTWGQKLTPIHVCLFGQFVIRVAVSVDRTVELLKGHEGHDEFVIGMEETAKPLF